MGVWQGLQTGKGWRQWYKYISISKTKEILEGIPTCTIANKWWLYPIYFMLYIVLCCMLNFILYIIYSIKHTKRWWNKEKGMNRHQIGVFLIYFLDAKTNLMCSSPTLEAAQQVLAGSPLTRCKGQCEATLPSFDACQSRMWWVSFSISGEARTIRKECWRANSTHAPTVSLAGSIPLSKPFKLWLRHWWKIRSCLFPVGHKRQTKRWVWKSLWRATHTTKVLELLFFLYL